MKALLLTALMLVGCNEPSELQTEEIAISLRQWMSVHGASRYTCGEGYGGGCSPAQVECTVSGGVLKAPVGLRCGVDQCVVFQRAH